MAYYECSNKSNNVVVEDVNYSLTTTPIVHHLDLANHKELNILGSLESSLTNTSVTKYALRYDLTDDNIFNELITTQCYLSSGSTFVKVKLDISKKINTFVTDYPNNQ